MPSDINYNQILCYTNSSITCQTIKQSFVEHNKLILILKDSQKITLAGKNIDTSGHKKRIRELIVMAKDWGFEIRDKSVKHYNKDKDGEKVLVKW